LAVKRREGVGRARNELPDPDRELLASDRLIVVGQTNDLARLLADVEAGEFPPDAAERA
jgi:Trk K+ transport system NAD-binding subunit